MAVPCEYCDEWCAGSVCERCADVICSDIGLTVYALRAIYEAASDPSVKTTRQVRRVGGGYVYIPRHPDPDTYSGSWMWS